MRLELLELLFVACAQDNRYVLNPGGRERLDKVKAWMEGKDEDLVIAAVRHNMRGRRSFFDNEDAWMSRVDQIYSLFSEYVTAPKGTTKDDPEPVAKAPVKKKRRTRKKKAPKAEQPKGSAAD